MENIENNPTSRTEELPAGLKDKSASDLIYTKLSPEEFNAVMEQGRKNVEEEKNKQAIADVRKKIEALP